MNGAGRCEHELVKLVRKSGLPECQDRGEDIIPASEVSRLRCDFANYLVDREESRMVLDQELENGVGERVHRPVGQRYSK